jgi:hypothetical protein
MEVPRLLAIDDVRLTAPAGLAGQLHEFYAGFLGFTPVQPAGPETCLAFRGFPRSGPRLFVTLTEVPEDRPPRRQAVILVDSLTRVADALSERHLWFQWSTGWFAHERRLLTQDPAGNWLELVASHPY